MVKNPNSIEFTYMGIGNLDFQPYRHQQTKYDLPDY